MPRRNTPDFSAYYTDRAMSSEPYLGDNSRLAEQFLRSRRNTPVYSIGQGLVEAGSDIASAYLLKKAGEKEREKEAAVGGAYDKAVRALADTGLSRDQGTGALWSKSDFAAPIFDQAKVNAAPALGAEDRANLAADMVARVDPKGAAQNRVGFYDLAAQFDQAKLTKDRQSAAAEALGGYDPNTQIFWNSGRRISGDKSYLKDNNGNYRETIVPNDLSREMERDNMASLMKAFPDEFRAKQLRELGVLPTEYGQPVAGRDAKGNPVFRRFSSSSVEGEEVPGFSPLKEPGAGGTEAEREAQQLIQDGVDPSDARDIAYNRVRVSRSPVDGSILLVNIRDGSARSPRYGGGGSSPNTPKAEYAGSGQSADPTGPMMPKPQTAANVPPPPVPGRAVMPGEQTPTPRQPLLSKVGVLGGVAPVQEFAGKVTMGGYDPGAALNEARQEFRLFENDVYDMMGGLDRMSNQDRERIQKMFADPGVFESDTRAYDLMASWSKEAKNIVQQQARVFQDPTQPPELRKAAAAKIEAAQRLMERVGDPSQIARPGSGMGDINQMGREQLQSLDPSRMSAIELRQASERWKALGGK